MQDIRGNEINNGDLVLRVLDGGSSSNRLIYAIILRDKPFFNKYEHVGITSYNKLKAEQLVKIDNPTDKEIDIKISLLEQVANYNGNNINVKHYVSDAQRILDALKI